MIGIVDANHLAHMFYHISDFKGHPDCVDDVLNWFLQRIENLQGAFTELALEHNHGNVTCIVAFDGPGASFRASIDENYKADREHDRQVFECVDAIQDCLSHSDEWQMMISPRSFEADDLIASVAHNTDEKVLIHSPDKDFNQCLVAGRVGIVKQSGVKDTKSHGVTVGSHFDMQYYTEALLRKQFGFGPDRWVDYQCLVGDGADNVKGADGIGDVTAKRIIQDSMGEPLPNLDPEEFGLNKRQLAGWPAFIERLSDLRDIFTLRTELRPAEAITERGNHSATLTAN